MIQTHNPKEYKAKTKSDAKVKEGKLIHIYFDHEPLMNLSKEKENIVHTHTHTYIYIYMGLLKVFSVVFFWVFSDLRKI